MPQLTEEMQERSEMPPGYVTVAQFAEKVGVTSARINHLRKQGRIEGARCHNQGYVVPENACILRTKNPSPGPVADYTKAWYERNKVS
jgi:hypothetical protein